MPATGHAAERAAPEPQPDVWNQLTVCAQGMRTAFTGPVDRVASTGCKEMMLVQVLRSCGAALVWVSHDDAQPSRVGGRVLQLPLGSQVGLPLTSADACQ